MDEVEKACWGGCVEPKVKVDWCDKDTFERIKVRFNKK